MFNTDALQKGGEWERNNTRWAGLKFFGFEFEFES